MDFQFFMSLIQNFGYFGAFLVGLLSSVTIFLPTPAFLVIFALSAPGFGFDPGLLGLCGGIGAAIGELTGYGVGYGGRELLLKKYEKTLQKIEKYFQKYRAEVLIFVFAVTPLPFDLIGIFCGSINFPVKKFISPLLVGKIIKYLFIAYAGFYGITWVSQMFGG